MTSRIWVRRLANVSLAIGILEMSPATVAQQAVAVEAPRLDGPLIFDSSSRGSGGNKIAGPKFRVFPLHGLAHPYAHPLLPEGRMLIPAPGGPSRRVRAA